MFNVASGEEMRQPRGEDEEEIQRMRAAVAARYESDGGVSLAGGRPGADQNADESGSTLPPPYFTIPYS